jgi:hypothetical protein
MSLPLQLVFPGYRLKSICQILFGYFFCTHILIEKPLASFVSQLPYFIEYSAHLNFTMIFDNFYFYYSRIILQ